MEVLTGRDLKASGTREPRFSFQTGVERGTLGLPGSSHSNPSGNRAIEMREEQAKEPPRAEVAPCRVCRVVFASGPQFPRLGHGLHECSRAHPGDGVPQGLSWRTPALSPRGVLLGRLPSWGDKIPAVSR